MGRGFGSKITVLPPSSRLGLRRRALALAILAAVATVPVPAAAQLFGDRSSDQSARRAPSRSFFSFPFFNGGHGSFFKPFGGFIRPPQPTESIKAPPPRKLETQPTTTVMVIGDSLADWLAYGLEETYATDAPDIGVVRNIHPTSGLVRYDPHNDALEWSQAVKDALETEKPSAIVVMLGLNDRLPLRDSAPAHAAAPAASQSPPNGEHPSPAGSTARPGPAYDFHTDQWADLYSKRIDDMIAALKTKGVPVLWVGLPAIRGPRSTSDMGYLDELYRTRAEKAGIIYVDIWDGFVDDQGRYAQQGPDFEGQIRRLRTYDGLHFTKAGAVKLAHYVEHELSRVLSNRVTPVALPGPEESTQPGAAGQQSAIGPVLPLTAAPTPQGGELLGGADHSAPATGDPMAASVLVRGDALAAPAGRADDFSWPRRGANATAPVASTSPAAPVASTPPTAPATAPAPGNDGKKADDGKVNTKPVAPAAVRRAPRAELDGVPRPPAAVRR